MTEASGALTPSLGLSQPRLARIGEAMRAHVERGAVAGIVALVARRDAVHVEAIGVQDLTNLNSMHGEIDLAAAIWGRGIPSSRNRRE